MLAAFSRPPPVPWQILWTESGQLHYENHTSLPHPRPHAPAGRGNYGFAHPRLRLGGESWLDPRPPLVGRYANNSSTDWGVNHDGQGQLTGYAYSANLGWITFEQTHGQPRVDLSTGDLSGYVWSANAGWIHLNTIHGKISTLSLDPGPDSDNDDLPDPWERFYVGLLTKFDSGQDYDNDGSPDETEYQAGTSPIASAVFLRILSYSSNGSNHQLEWSNSPLRLYQVQISDDLTDENAREDYNPTPLPPVSGSSRSMLVDNLSGSIRFFRITPLLPIPPSQP